jgi:hypothetical protein
MEMPMRSARCLILVAVLGVAGPVLSACESIDAITESWDSKKKLTGDRKPVFPDGVPGVSTGVPAELVKGYREPEGGLTDPAKVAAEAAADTAAKPKPQRTASTKPASKPKPKKTDDASAQQQQQPAQAATAPWPSQPAQQQQQQAPWPGSR